jgi:hypothetical protein
VGVASVLRIGSLKHCDSSSLPGHGRSFRPSPEFQLLLDFANRARGGIALSVLQHDQVLALEHGLKLPDLVKVGDDRAADAQESLRGSDSNELMLSRRK